MKKLFRIQLPTGEMLGGYGDCFEALKFLKAFCWKDTLARDVKILWGE